MKPLLRDRMPLPFIATCAVALAVLVVDGRPLGDVIGALVFGLAHAPGILLRRAGAIEGLGDSPGVVTTLADVIVTQGVAGLASACSGHSRAVSFW